MHIPPSQVVARIGKMGRRLLRRRLPQLCKLKHEFRSRQIPPWGTPPRSTAPFVNGSEAANIVADIESGSFRFYGCKLNVGRPVCWTPAGVSYMWRYKLHSFDYLEALSACAQARPEQRHTYVDLGRDLILDWIQNCRYPDEPAWEPYPLSLRLIYWSRFLQQFQEVRDEVIRRSIYQQLCYLRRNVEYDLANNHVLENLVAIILAATLYVGTEEVKGLRRYASERLGRVLSELLTGDGALVERSASYHTTVLARLLMLMPVQSAGLSAIPCLADAAAKMSSIMYSYRVPGERLVNFNDSAPNMAPPVPIVMQVAKQEGIAVLGKHEHDGSFDGTELFRFESGRYHCFVDCGAPAPAENPGHCHAAIGAFVLYWGGKPIIVDPGCSTYDSGGQRLFERSTLAHNTITIDGLDQSEIWDRFRFGRRASVRWRDAIVNSDAGSLAIRHDGFVMQRRNVLHTRRFFFAKDFIVIADGIAAVDPGQCREHEVAMLISFDPSVGIRADGRKIVCTDGMAEIVTVSYCPHWTATESDTTVSEYFGSTKKTRAAQLRATVDESTVLLTVIAADRVPVRYLAGSPAVCVGEIKVWFEGNDLAPMCEPITADYTGVMAMS